ncbi:hypothetical protein D3C76_815130 [compost metagenome]
MLQGDAVFGHFQYFQGGALLDHLLGIGVSSLALLLQPAGDICPVRLPIHVRVIQVHRQLIDQVHQVSCNQPGLCYRLVEVETHPATDRFATRLQAQRPNFSSVLQQLPSLLIAITVPHTQIATAILRQLLHCQGSGALGERCVTAVSKSQLPAAKANRPGFARTRIDKKTPDTPDLAILRVLSHDHDPQSRCKQVKPTPPGARLITCDFEGHEHEARTVRLQGASLAQHACQPLGRTGQPLVFGRLEAVFVEHDIQLAHLQFLTEEEMRPAIHTVRLAGRADEHKACATTFQVPEQLATGLAVDDMCTNRTPRLCQVHLIGHTRMEHLRGPGDQAMIVG